MKKFLLSLLAVATSLVSSAESISLEFTSLETIKKDTSWGTSYANHSYSTDNWVLNFTSFGKQNATITDVPVTKTGDITLSLKNNQTFETVSVELEQWGTKQKTATLQYSIDGTNFSDFTPAISSSNFSIEATSIPTGTVAIKLAFSNSSDAKNQVGVSSITYTAVGGSVTPKPTVCDEPTFSATELYVDEELTITSTAGSKIMYFVSGPESFEDEGDSPVAITFSTPGTYTIEAVASKEGLESAEATETIIVSEKPDGDINITSESFNISGTAYAAYTFKSSVTNVTYAAKTGLNNGIQINTDATSAAQKSGITITENPEGLIIAKIIIRTYAEANGKIKDIAFSNTPGVLTEASTSADIAVGFPENTVTTSVSPSKSADNKTFTFTPTDDFKYFLLTSSKAIQITGFDVLYKKPAVVEPVAPKAPVVMIDGVEVTDLAQTIDLSNGGVELTLTADEGHHIYHKHEETAASVLYYDGEEEDIHAGFTPVLSNTATIKVNKNGTLTYYAFNPETQMKSEPVSLSFGGADTTSISEIETENGAEAWFDLQGRRVAAPSKGLYIVRNGNQATKIRL